MQHLHPFTRKPAHIFLGDLTGIFIPRKPRCSQSSEGWGCGPTPDALLLAPRATERFLRPVKPAGCAQGSKIQQIPGQLSGGSYFVKGHTEIKTLKIFENVNYRLAKLTRDCTCSLWMNSCMDRVIYSLFMTCKIIISMKNIISVLWS